MIKRLFYSCLLTVMLTGPAFGLDLALEPCLDEVEQMTDIKFVFPGHALITTQSGDIYWFQGCNKKLLKISTIDVATSDWELGLYSVAVASDFLKNPRVFLYYAAQTDGRLTTRLSAFQLNLKDKDSDVFVTEKVLLEIDQPDTNSNGGALKFGPDGLLYLGVGDGGSDGDPEANAQNIHSILGSIVRIKPDFKTEKGYTIPDGNLQDFIPGALPEIFAYGVHNPWKMTFDEKGNLIIADVGEHLIEEVDVISRDMIGTQALNLGWNIKEGDNCFNPPEQCDSQGLINPVYQYEHGDSGNSITGGETIRLDDKEYYVFGDYLTGLLGVLDLDAPETPVFEKRFSGNWATFGKDLRFGRGSIFNKDHSGSGVYVADYTSGTLYQIILKP
jgi:hypothetical protein